MLEPNDLKWANVPTLPPGAKVAVLEGPPNQPVPFMMCLKFPANYKVPAHWHPAIEHLTVLSGTFNMGIGDKLDTTKTKALSPGGVMIIQPKVPHFAWTSEEVMVQVHGVGPWGITYVDPQTIPERNNPVPRSNPARCVRQSTESADCVSATRLSQIPLSSYRFGEPIGKNRCSTNFSLAKQIRP
jgi:quercetin dioxygenase-like cupin family protein